MRKIALIHSSKAYLPEIQAYQCYLSKHGYEVESYSGVNKKKLSGFDIVWYFMGTDMTSPSKNRLKIHEYISPSIPPYAKFKNYIKREFNKRPDLRIFQNVFVEKSLGFQDSIPKIYREAGISSFFFQERNLLPKIFDFVYIGSTHQSRQISVLISAFLKHIPRKKLLIVGTPPKGLSSVIQNHTSIYFTGKIPNCEVPKWLQKAKYGLNFIPNIYPYNHMRSLKLLEYCASGLSIITTSYNWVNQFEQERKAKFYKLKPDFSNFNINEIESYHYHTPDVSDLIWENIFDTSGILSFLDMHSK